MRKKFNRIKNIDIKKKQLEFKCQGVNINNHYIK